MSRGKVVFFLAVLVTVAVNGYAGYITVPAGYTVRDVIFPLQSGEFVAGFDRLPNNNFVAFAGSRILEVSPSGSVSVLYAFDTPVFGSFVKVRGDSIYFGESSNGTIWEMDCTGSNPRLLGTIGNNFDLEFNSLGQAFVSANPGWAGQKIFYFHGESDEIVTGLQGYSGPLAFDGSDNLLYATAWAYGGDSIMRFRADDVARAIGPTSLTQADAEILARPISSPYDLELDTWGNIFFTSGNRIYQLKSGLSSPSSFAVAENPYDYLTTLRWYSVDNSLSVLVGGESFGVISTITPVPEPSAFSVLLLSFAVMGPRFMKFRRKSPA